MTWISSLGFDAYVGLGIAPTSALLIPPHIAVQRLRTLSQLVEPDSSRQRWVHELIDDRWAEWGAYPGGDLESSPVDDSSPDSSYEDRWSDTEVEVVLTESGRGRSLSNTASKTMAPEPPTLLTFQVRVASRLLTRAWEFHKGDPDPYPSVPHGHELQGRQAKKYPKLDAYRGYIYGDSGVEIGRESKKAIIALWNNANFRTFAHEALEHLLQADPTFHNRLSLERELRYPTRLPRKR